MSWSPGRGALGPGQQEASGHAGEGWMRPCLYSTNVEDLRLALLLCQKFLMIFWNREGCCPGFLLNGNIVYMMEITKGLSDKIKRGLMCQMGKLSNMSR